MGAAAGRGLHASNRSLTLISLSCRLIPGRGPTDLHLHHPGERQSGVPGLETKMFESQVGNFKPQLFRLNYNLYSRQQKSAVNLCKHVR